MSRIGDGNVRGNVQWKRSAELVLWGNVRIALFKWLLTSGHPVDSPSGQLALRTTRPRGQPIFP